MILLAVSIAACAFVFSRTITMNCDNSVQNSQPVEIVLDITATSKLETSITTTTTSTTSSILTTSKTTTSTTTPTTSTTQTACGFWGCDFQLAGDQLIQSWGSESTTEGWNQFE